MSSWWAGYGCGCGNVRGSLELETEEVSRRVRLLSATENVKGSVVTDVFDVVCSVCILSS